MTVFPSKRLSTITLIEYNIISFTPLIKIFQLLFLSSNIVIVFWYYDEKSALKCKSSDYSMGDNDTY